MKKECQELTRKKGIEVINMLSIDQIIKLVEENYQNNLEIIRKYIDDNSLFGIPIMISKKMLLIHYEYDFMLDGFKILNLSDITKINVNDRRKFDYYIMQKEGALDTNDNQLIYSIDSWKDVSNQFLQLKTIINVECENNDEFYLGKIVAVCDDYIRFQTMDALCRWSKKIIEINYKDITLVSYDNRYTNIISKYSWNDYLKFKKNLIKDK